MFRSAKSLVSERSIIHLRNAGNVLAPADPASTAVVTPLATLAGSGGIPKPDAPRKHAHVNLLDRE